MILLRSILFNLVFYGGTFGLTLWGQGLRVFAPARVEGLAQLWARLGIWALGWTCGIRVELSGREHLPASGPALIASQHQSAFDTMVWITLLPRCCYVLKQELVEIPLFGPLVAGTGMIAVDRGAGAAAMRALIRGGRDARDAGHQIVIFPEGTRAPAGAHLPLQPGIAALASATGLPVIPAVTDSGRHWGRRAFRKLPGTIRIQLLPPLPARLPRGELMARLDAALREGSAALDRPVDKCVG